MSKSPEIPEITTNDAPNETFATHLGSRLLRTVLAGGLAGLSYGALQETVPVQVGPHPGEARMTLDSAVTFDIGPGALRPDIEDLPLDLGIKVDLKGIPITGSVEEGQQGFTQADIEEYARFFADTSVTESEIRNAMKAHLMKYSIAGALAALVIGEGLIGYRRQRELTDSMSTGIGRKLLVATVATSLFVGGNYIVDQQQPEDGFVPVSTKFNGTPLEGAEIQGRQLNILINDYGADALGYLETNDEFYDLVVENLREATEESTLIRPSENHHMALLYTDLHANLGMARVMGELAEVAEAKFAFDAGDTVISGTAIEGYFVRVVGRELRDIPSKAATDGNHGSRETEEQLRDQGFLVTDGRVEDVGGLRVLGDDDPRRSIIGQEIFAEREETNAEMGERLADVACADEKGVDILLVSSPIAAAESVRRGCVDMAFYGDTHTHESKIVTAENGHRILSLNGGTAGGASKNRPTFGPLKDPAQLNLMKFDKDTGQPTVMQLITVKVDGSVTIGEPVYLPQNPEEEALTTVDSIGA